MTWKTVLYCTLLCKEAVSVVLAFSDFFPPLFFWKQYDVKELHSTKTIMEVVRGLCKTSSVWVLLEWSLQWLDFWIIRQTAHIVTSTVYGAEANTDKFDSHASVSAKTLVTRSLAKGAIRAMETVSALPRSQALWEVGSAQLSWDVPERWALSSQIGGNVKTSHWLRLFPTQLHQQNIAKKCLSRMI